MKPVSSLVVLLSLFLPFSVHAELKTVDEQKAEEVLDDFKSNKFQSKLNQQTNAVEVIFMKIEGRVEREVNRIEDEDIVPDPKG